MSKAFLCNDCGQMFTKGEDEDAETGKHDVKTKIYNDHGVSLKDKPRNISIDIQIYSGDERGMGSSRGTNGKPDIDLCPMCLSMVIQGAFHNKHYEKVDWNF